MEQYSIWEGHMEDLKQKMVKIQNKCKKFGFDFSFNEVGEEFKLVKDPTDGKEQLCRFVIVEAEGIAKINDWKFIASVEHTKEGNIFSKAVNTLEIPERYRNSDPICEHCHSNRTRKDTFIIQNTITGEFKQVGKSCLKDFTQGMDASSVAWFASLKNIFEELEDKKPNLGSYHETYIPTEEILQYAAETIRHLGYVKADEWGNSSTKEKVMDIWKVNTGRTGWMHPDVIKDIKNQMQKINFNPDSEEAKNMVQDAMNWIMNQEESNDYMHNLITSCKLEYANWNRIGILVSLFPTYNRNLEVKSKKELEKEQQDLEAKMSQFIGKEGDRIQINIKAVKCITSWESIFGCYRQTVYIWKIVDDQNNVYTWKTSTDIDVDNPPKSLKGTVKEHKTFRDVKQTELTRCKIVA